MRKTGCVSFSLYAVCWASGGQPKNWPQRRSGKKETGFVSHRLSVTNRPPTPHHTHTSHNTQHTLLTPPTQHTTHTTNSNTTHNTTHTTNSNTTHNTTHNTQHINLPPRHRFTDRHKHF